eukprot:COSAG01_NODE_12500_length_1727_cov_18.961940_2_plen_271_part_00
MAAQQQRRWRRRPPAPLCLFLFLIATLQLSTWTAGAAANNHKCDVLISGPIMVLGGELPGTPVKKDSWADCCATCWNDDKFKDECTRVCFNHETKECWLHNQAGGSLVNSKDMAMTWCGPPANEAPEHDCKHYPKVGEKCTALEHPCCGKATCQFDDGVNQPGKCVPQSKVMDTGPEIWQVVLVASCLGAVFLLAAAKVYGRDFVSMLRSTAGLVRDGVAFSTSFVRPRATRAGNRAALLSVQSTTADTSGAAAVVIASGGGSCGHRRQQ